MQGCSGYDVYLSLECELGIILKGPNREPAVTLTINEKVNIA